MDSGAIRIDWQDEGDGPLRPLSMTGELPNEHTLNALAHLAEEMGRDLWRSSSDVAQVVACYLRCHPSVQDVRYPGLKGDPLFQIASRTLVAGFGPYVWYCADGVWHRLTCGPVDPRLSVMTLERSLPRGTGE